MSKAKKLLSALLAMVMLISVVSTAASAARVEYRNANIFLGGGGYDEVDKVYLSTQQYACMAMDEIDRMLAKENLIIKEDLLGLITINVNASSVDNLITSIHDVWSMAQSVLPIIGGDIQTLDLSAFATATSFPKRGTAAKTDIDIFKGLIGVLSANRGIVAKLAGGTLDLGVLASLKVSGVELGSFLDLQKLVKEMAYGLVYPDATVPATLPTVDTMVQELINKTVVGTYNPATQEYEGGLLPELADFMSLINISTTSLYDIVEGAFRSLYNIKVVPFLNSSTIRDYVTDAAQDYPDLIDANYVIPTIDFDGPSWAGVTNFVDKANDILGAIIEAIAVFDVNWVYGSNTNFLSNVVAAGKTIVKLTGNAFFPDYVKVATPAQIDAMDNMQFVAYLARSTVNGSIDYVNVPDSCDTLKKVAVYTLKALEADYIPFQYSQTSVRNLALDSTNSILEIGADFAIYFLTQSLGVSDLYYDLNFEGTISAIVNWAVSEYGGAISTIGGGSNAWTKLSNVIFGIIPSYWLPLKDGQPRNNVRSIIVDDVLENLLTLNFDNLFALLQRNPSTQPGALGTNLTSIIVTLFANIINTVFPGVAGTYSSFEDLISKPKLSSLVSNLLNSLSTRFDSYFPALIPLACQILELSTPQDLGFPYVSLASNITGPGTFYIQNASSGINTAYTTKYGDTPSTSFYDKLYTYKITSATTNQPSVTVKNGTTTITEAAPLNVEGGEAKNLTIAGIPTNNSVLVITLTYQILDERGTSMTTNPMTETLYTFVTSIVDDGLSTSKVTVDTDERTVNNPHYMTEVKATYINQDGDVDDITDYSITLARKVSPNDIVHQNNATITVGAQTTVDGYLGDFTYTPVNLTSTKKGLQEQVNPYTALPGAVKPEDGLYESNFEYICSPTMNGGPSETLFYTHYFYFYNDYDLPSIFNSAVNANRQRADYSDTAKFNAYITAMTNAAAVVYRPRIINNFALTHVNNYETLAVALEDAITALEATAISAGIGGLETEYRRWVPDNTIPNPDYNPALEESSTNQKRLDKEYNDPSYVYNSMADYVPYSYLRFRDSANTVKGMIDAATRTEKPASYSAIELKYAEHKIKLNGERQLRFGADKYALNEEITKANAIGTVQGGYTDESWTRFTNARTFAIATNALAIGEVDDFTGVLLTEGLKQSQANKARGELIYATKLLVTGCNYAVLDANIAEGETYTNAAPYTSASWTALQTAITEGKAIEREMANTTDNQKLIDDAAQAIRDAITGLKMKANYTLLNSTIAEAEAINTSLYTEASVLALTSALSAAKGLSKDLPVSQQSEIDTAESALRAAINGLVTSGPQNCEIVNINGGTFKVMELVPEIHGSNLGYVMYGYIPTLSYFMDFISISNGGSYYKTRIDALNPEEFESTGCEINILDSNNNFVKKLTTVYYGDINGDYEINFKDVSQVANATKFIGAFSEGNPFVSAPTLAADVNHDWEYTVIDINTILSVAKTYNDTIDQLPLDNYFTFE